jgi:hypothetical protein
MHEPAGTEPGRKTAGTVVILARDTIGAVARTSWETTGPDPLTPAGTEFCQIGQFCVTGTRQLRNDHQGIRPGPGGFGPAVPAGPARHGWLLIRACLRSLGITMAGRPSATAKSAYPASRMSFGGGWEPTPSSPRRLVHETRRGSSRAG